MASNPPTAASTPPPDLVTLTIDGREVRAPKGTLVVEAAKRVGIDIPIFCYHPKLRPVGACRMCLVEIEKMPRLQTACTSPVADGMVVSTNSANVVDAQNGVIELLLANHPLDCPICDKGGECPLQDNAFEWGLGVSRFTETKRRKDKAFVLSDRIVLDRERCIMCFRCTRFQAEIPGDEALAAVDRGGYSEIGVLEGERFDSPFSGNTIELCPVGALTSREYRFQARPWDLHRTPSTCVGCAVGCNVELHARDGQLLRIVSRENREVDDGWLCDLGRFDNMPPPLNERVTHPLVRSGATMEPASWETAFGRAIDLLRGGEVGLIASPSLSNEAIWLFSNGLRAALPDADACFWPTIGRGWPIQGSIAEIPRSRTVVLVGLDPWVEFPVLALWVRRAALFGATLIVVGPENGLYRDTAHWLKVPAGDEPRVIGELLSARERGSAIDAAAAIDGRAAFAGRVCDDAAIAAAAWDLGAGPGTLLIHPRLGSDPAFTDGLARLAEAIGADGEGGMVGSADRSANARAARDLAPDVVNADAGSLSGCRTVLLFGDEAWPSTGCARRIVVSSVPLEPDESVDVMLPIAHLYEQAGSITNLEGRVQILEAGAVAPAGVPPDWRLLAELVDRLGGSTPGELAAIRKQVVEAHPNFRVQESAVGRRGGLALPVA